MYDICCSIDVGLSGGISFFDYETKELLSLYSMPTKQSTNKSGREKKVIDLDHLLHILEIPKTHNDDTIVVFEVIHSFGDAGFGVGTLMEQLGIVRGMVKALGYDETQVAPQTWQRHHGLVCPKDVKGTTGKKTKYLRRKWLKAKSLEVAREKFPSCHEKLKRADSDGKSDALLIGSYYLTQCQNENP